MLTEDERHQLLETWNETTVAYPNYTTLCQLFEEQVARRPHATAVTSIDGTLSYQELNAKANQLARTLRKRGVQTETLVGICMDRSTETLVGPARYPQSGRSLCTNRSNISSRPHRLHARG